MKPVIAFLCVFAALLSPSCMKAPTPVPDQYQDYVGDWSGENDSAIVINADGSASLKMVNVEGNSTLTHTADPTSVAFKADQIVFEGVFGLNFTYTIDRAPARVDGRWVMVIDGVTFVR